MEKKRNPLYIAKARDAARRGWAVDREGRIRAILKASQVSPNGSELRLFDYINQVHPTYELNVSGDVIAGFVPDFVDRQQRKVIELFGERWHPKSDEERKIKRYAEYGYECLVVWWGELKKPDTLFGKINSFAFKRCSR